MLFDAADDPKYPFLGPGGWIFPTILLVATLGGFLVGVVVSALVGSAVPAVFGFIGGLFLGFALCEWIWSIPAPKKG